MTIQPALALRGELTVPGDKSISHRQVILAALANGISRIEGLLLSEDVQATMDILSAMGVHFSRRDFLTIHGVGLKGLKAPQHVLNCGNSGTTMRLLMGVLAAQNFVSLLTGDESLGKRPMDRVINPLNEMGAQISIIHENGKRLIRIVGNPNLKDIDYKSPVASAQIKSSLLLAGLASGARVRFSEPAPSRNHTEQILTALKLPLRRENDCLILNPVTAVPPFHGRVPADFSSAAFFIVGALILPGSQVHLKKIGLNPTRTGLLDALSAMGAKIEITETAEVMGEAIGDVQVSAQPLHATKLSGDLIPRLIDEIPIWTLAAAVAEGESVVGDAAELRVKESDRISAITKLLQVLGVKIQSRADGFSLLGPNQFQGGEFDCHGDHRLAMTAAIAALRASQPITIHGTETVATSYPQFFSDLKCLTSPSPDPSRREGNFK